MTYTIEIGPALADALTTLSLVLGFWAAMYAIGVLAALRGRS